MTGIEIFANLVAAYDGAPRQKSRKAFGSLLIVMGTTSVTMLVVGPAILALSDPTDERVSVFTQTMDKLLPSPLPYVGTLVGIAVLLSAAAASAQGLQNLALGIRFRHYMPASFGQRNRFDVADQPVWLQVGLVVLCFVAFGTDEETYLALYAAGVFILLSMTGWAASKRLLRILRGNVAPGRLTALAGTTLAAVLTSGATVVIFEERFFEGAWTYLLFVPALYALFTYQRRRLGDPTPVEEVLARLHSEGMYPRPHPESLLEETVAFQELLVPLDGTIAAEQALFAARTFGHTFDARLTLVLVETGAPALATDPAREGREAYLQQIVEQLGHDGIRATYSIRPGNAAEAIHRMAREQRVDMIVVSETGQARLGQWLGGSLAGDVVALTTTPVLVVRPTDDWRSRRSRFRQLLVALDGSEVAERGLRFAIALADRFASEVLVLSVPEGTEPEGYAAQVEQYLERIAATFREAGIPARTMVAGSGPERTIVALADSEAADLIVLATHGRGGAHRVDRVAVGSVAGSVTHETPCPVLVVPARDKSDAV